MTPRLCQQVWLLAPVRYVLCPTKEIIMNTLGQRPVPQSENGREGVCRRDAGVGCEPELHLLIAINDAASRPHCYAAYRRNTQPRDCSRARSVSLSADPTLWALRPLRGARVIGIGLHPRSAGPHRPQKV